MAKHYSDDLLKARAEANRWHSQYERAETARKAAERRTEDLEEARDVHQQAHPNGCGTAPPEPRCENCIPGIPHSILCHRVS